LKKKYIGFLNNFNEVVLIMPIYKDREYILARDSSVGKKERAKKGRRYEPQTGSQIPAGRLPERRGKYSDKQFAFMCITRCLMLSLLRGRVYDSGGAVYRGQPSAADINISVNQIVIKEHISIIELS
jgi:hypothetical protein